MSLLPGTNGTDAVFRFVSQLQQSIAVGMAQPCGEAVRGIADAADGLPCSLSPLETRVVRGVLIETLIRLPKVAAVVPDARYHQCLQDVASADYCGLSAAFQRACHALAVSALGEHSERGSIPADPRVRICLDRIRADPGRRHCLTSLAADVGLSRWHLERLIKVETGFTFTANVRLVRMHCAADKLRSPLRRIKEVAVDLGYTHQSDFCRDFRRIHGIGPRRWRQQTGVHQ